jgi:hypothetical protein
MMGIAQAALRFLQNPSGTIAQAGRQCLEFLYSGILAAAPVAAVPRALPLLASRSTAVACGAQRTNTPALLASRSNTLTLGARE